MSYQGIAFVQQNIGSVFIFINQGYLRVVQAQWF